MSANYFFWHCPELIWENGFNNLVALVSSSGHSSCKSSSLSKEHGNIIKSCWSHQPSVSHLCLSPICQERKSPKTSTYWMKPSKYLRRILKFWNCMRPYYVISDLWWFPFWMELTEGLNCLDYNAQYHGFTWGRTEPFDCDCWQGLARTLDHNVRKELTH